ncbi:hypothetical protein JHK82_022756 [Glycine max]|nr:hypothetical protein JHK82_022756 [Glycine max]
MRSLGSREAERPEFPCESRRNRGISGRGDELEDKGAARADVVAAGEEVAANEGFEDAGLAIASAADDGDLGEVNGGLAFNAGEEVLKAVDHAGEDVLNLARVLI